MSPAPTLQELIETVLADAAGDDALEQLAQASRTVAQLEETNDALLSHFVDRCRRSGRSWSEISGALGVSKQAVHKRFSVTAAPTFERFTPRARDVLERAAGEARSLGEAAVGTEHLLLALFEPPEAVAAQALARAGLTRQGCEEQIRALRPARGSESSGRPYRPGALEALRGALEEALLLGHNYVGTEHLLLALLRRPDDLAARALAALGGSADDLRGRVSAVLAELTAP